MAFNAACNTNKDRVSQKLLTRKISIKIVKKTLKLGKEKEC